MTSVDCTLSHPTVKPRALLEDALLDITRHGDIVIDCFAGSGSTLLAAEKVGRRCRAIEIDNPYCDLIIRRWEAATGREAVSEATGEIFARAAERRKSPGKPDKETPDNDELNAEITLDRAGDANRERTTMAKTNAPKKKPTGDYAVGYAKTPECGKFQPHHSGNIKGRPKGRSSPGVQNERLLPFRLVLRNGHFGSALATAKDRPRKIG